MQRKVGTRMYHTNIFRLIAANCWCYRAKNTQRALVTGVSNDILLLPFICKRSVMPTHIWQRQQRLRQVYFSYISLMLLHRLYFKTESICSAEYLYIIILYYSIYIRVLLQYTTTIKTETIWWPQRVLWTALGSWQFECQTWWPSTFFVSKVILISEVSPWSLSSVSVSRRNKW